MTISFNGTSGVTFPDASTQATAATGFGFKNRIINGAMMIDQRNAGASVTVGSGNTYTLDRWEASSALASKFSVQQSTTAPAGFVNSLLITSLAATTPGASDQYSIRQKVEGLNISDLGWGAAGAATVTISFWVRSSLTGTFGGALENSGFTRAYPFSYTINSANTWEQKSVTIAGDTSGTWLTTNGLGIMVNFSVGAGSSVSGTAGSWASADYRSTTGATSVVGTSGATFYITGVQLEKGSTATSFDYRPYGAELALCQRYYEALSANAGTNVGAGSFITLGVCENTTRVQPYYTFKVQKRTAPSTTLSAISTFGLRSTGSSVVCSSGAFGAPTPVYAQGEFNNAGGGLIAGGAGWLVNHTGAATIEWSAEL